MHAYVYNIIKTMLADVSLTDISQYWEISNGNDSLYAQVIEKEFICAR